MVLNTMAAAAQSAPVDEALVSRFFARATFPETGEELMKTAQRNGAPQHLVRAIQRLTPAKVYHNTYEVWFDAVHPLHAHAA